ncbi:PAS domain-containing sensor histidine kinase [Azospirillum doebereinerae]|uniref:PAS domain-containing sensor histidine kinase n=1 Tax=Azospirillum doebereinerae TaxID=92933 RepID=UPI001FD410D6|nr:PAS-domain containing protein [Azospirillum doebereinerae]
MARSEDCGLTNCGPVDCGLAGLDLLAGLAAPLWLARPDGRVVWLNEAARALLDMAPGAAARTVHLLCPDETIQALTGALTAGRRIDRTLTFQHGRAAAPLEIDARIARAPHSDPPLLLIEGTADRVARQEVLRLTEQLVALTYAFPDLRFELRLDGTILDFAASSPSDLNIPAERFLNGRVQDVLPEPAAGLVMAALDSLRAGETVAGADFTLPDPESGVEGDAAFEVRLVALMDGQRAVCSVRNVTARARAEHAARQAHALLLDAIDSVTEGFVLYDAQDRLVVCNQRYRDLFIGDPDLAQPGTSFESVLREGARRGLYRVPPEGLEAWIQERLALHRTGGPPAEVQLRDGRWLRIEERRTSGGGTVGVRTDITDLKQRTLELATARDLAESANQRKSDYVHHLSHELRTPLTAVLGFAEILRDQLMGPPDNPRYREAAGQIVTAGDYMLELINNLLDLARIEAGRMELYEEPCNLSLLVDATAAMMAERAARGSVSLNWDVPPELPCLFGDPSLIRQMLTNLIGNAVKFTPAGGRIAVEAALESDGGLTLSVRDTGRGMATDKIPLALAAFCQAHDRMTVPEHGSGLGLPLTCALMSLHGGRLSIDSAPGEGTCVRLLFPAARVGVDEAA